MSLRDGRALLCASEILAPFIAAEVVSEDVIPYVAMLIQGHVKADEAAQQRDALKATGLTVVKGGRA